MSDVLPGRDRQVLDPRDRLSEVTYGLILILTITGSFSIANAGQAEVQSMFIGALGCSAAWGIVDAVMHLLGRVSERGRNFAMVRTLRVTSDPEEARRLVSDAVPPGIAALVQPAEWDELLRRLNELPEPPARARLAKDDWLGALAIFLLGFFATLPVAIPFLLIRDAVVAMRTSNGIAVTMLFFLGLGLGRYVGYSPWRMGFWMVLLGAVLVCSTVALGG